jgi:hypothetical protein
MAEPGSDHLRQQLGVWLKDRWRWERALRSSSRRYLALANRREMLEAAPDGSGYACRWTFTSRLHAPLVQPHLGQRLLSRCLADAPIAHSPSQEPFNGAPELSVLIGHRGQERLPLLLATLESLAAQEGVKLECLVIEQDSKVRIREALPGWVRHLHAPLGDPEAPYNRSHTFNCGALAARGSVLLLHDNDMLVPRGYGKRILQRIRAGYQVVNPKRFVFYLQAGHSQGVLEGRSDLDQLPAEVIVQNLEAGGSLAITAQAYASLGGMDEEFRGWGGEDNEFWDRCLTLPTWIWGYEPIVHLWHRSQPLKGQSDNPNLERARTLLRQSASERIQTLVQRRGRTREQE